MNVARQGLQTRLGVKICNDCCSSRFATRLVVKVRNEGCSSRFANKTGRQGLQQDWLSRFANMFAMKVCVKVVCNECCSSMFATRLVVKVLQTLKDARQGLQTSKPVPSRFATRLVVKVCKHGYASRFLNECCSSRFATSLVGRQGLQ